MSCELTNYGVNNCPLVHSRDILTAAIVWITAACRFRVAIDDGQLSVQRTALLAFIPPFPKVRDDIFLVQNRAAVSEL